MSFPRSSGILLHPTSLPGPYGVGDLGPAAFKFADCLAHAGQSIWQMLPLGPTGYGNSPYQCLSAFAGNPLLISLDAIDARDYFPAPPKFREDEVEYESITAFKFKTLSALHANQSASAECKEKIDRFRETERSWLSDFALFNALKDSFGGRPWWQWDRDFAARTPDALDRARRELAPDIALHEYLQFAFFEQWSALKNYCRKKDIRLMGDLPIYVAHDSSDVWAHPEYFCLTQDGRAEKVAGVPPDYFSATGQLWGNPIYRWDLIKADGYSWWIERFRASFRLFDMLRVDHFRGFEAYWEVPGGDTTAQNGKWIKGPGAELFATVESQLGPLPILAENLGVITPEVEAIRERFGFPGMAILQFAFGNDPQGPSFRPHNYPRNIVAYTGTHDNDTVVGWWTSKPGAGSIRTEEDIRKERAFTKAYLALNGEEINWRFIRTLMASVADTVIFPLQDVLGMGSQARMNVPGTATGNWRWRFRGENLNEQITGRLREMAAIYDRLPPSR
ncbi:MAG TPA: 4-alpha-glucanotransferase [Terriglobales bacterium]|nr:4-alpha-glucanotransferase [Terriglobales bacterium]